MKKCLKSTSLCLALAFTISSSVSYAIQGGSIGQGDFSVMNGSQLVDKLSGQNPVADESMLVCDGKCMVKSEGVSLVASDKAKFAIKNESDTFRLYLREGSVDYVITDKARKIAFHTPERVYSVAEIVFNAASTPVVRGTVKVNKEGKTEISVTEGKLVFATAEGMKAVAANEKIVLAVSSAPPEPDKNDNTGLFIFGGVTAALATGIILLNNSDDGSNPSPTPTPTPRPTPAASPNS